MKTVKTYMSIPQTLDPAHILSMADLELSVALASTLVSFDQERQVTAALAEKWIILPPNKIEFKIRNNLKWSDGSSITAIDFKRSLERAKKVYGADLKALFDSIESIEATNELTLRIITKEEVQKSGILLKLTEPMYGLLSVDGSDINPLRTSGPYYLSKKSYTGLELKANTNWYKYKTDMPQAVSIKAPPSGIDLIQYFQNDDWANLISGSSIMKTTTRESLQRSGIKFWERSLDKVFALFPSKSFVEKDGSKIIRYISHHFDMGTLSKKIAGITPADQFFPRGYELWSSISPVVKNSENVESSTTIKVIIPETTYTSSLKEVLQESLNSIKSIRFEVSSVKLADLNDRMIKGDYDILATGLAVADPNFEGAMSFFFERSPAFVTSGKGVNNFAEKVKKARELSISKDRALSMRNIVIEAQESGYVLPLFHFSSLALAKPGIDLSQIPNSDETVVFWKVRMHE